jgi:MFS family permease
MAGGNGSIRLGLHENLGQFSLLVLINVFVRMMVGLERTVVPLIGEKEFGLVSKTAIVSFIVSFGVTKAICNLFAARVSETVGRKKILVLGWLIGLPVPFIIIFANRWLWFDVANVLLGMNQALCWSMTVIMKVDLVGPTERLGARVERVCRVSGRRIHRLDYRLHSVGVRTSSAAFLPGHRRSGRRAVALSFPG